MDSDVLAGDPITLLNSLHEFCAMYSQEDLPIKRFDPVIIMHVPHAAYYDNHVNIFFYLLVFE
jgi:hypothetical protein